jgi:hypothetical protein
MLNAFRKSVFARRAFRRTFEQKRRSIHVSSLAGQISQPRYQGREPTSEWWADVRFGAHSGLTPVIA